jgi:hypothetical protein
MLGDDQLMSPAILLQSLCQCHLVQEKVRAHKLARRGEIHKSNPLCPRHDMREMKKCCLYQYQPASPYRLSNLIR